MNMTTQPEVEVCGEGPILLTVKAPTYYEDGSFKSMEVSLRRRFPSAYLAKQYVAATLDEGKGLDLSFEVTPAITDLPRMLAIVERFTEPEAACPA